MPKSVRFTKRLMDIVISLMVLVLFFPIWLLIAILIRVTSKGPALYKQTRVLQCGNYDFHERCIPQDKEDTFTMYKFRTMVQDAENIVGAVNAEENDPRVTFVGRFLRSTRIDEIPNFINVLLGHMSVVGPRADRMEIISNVLEDFPYVWERTRFVKPGITGLAQIHLRSNGTLNGNKVFAELLPKGDIDEPVLSFRYKMYYDFTYQAKMTKFWSFLITDLTILFRTPIVMFIRRNTV